MLNESPPQHSHRKQVFLAEFLLYGENYYVFYSTNSTHAEERIRQNVVHQNGRSKEKREKSRENGKGKKSRGKKKGRRKET